MAGDETGHVTRTILTTHLSPAVLTEGRRYGRQGS
jgi:hypothetical protein